MAKKHTAQCACGAVRFVLDTDPTFVAVCHCLDCKKSSGGETGNPFASAKLREPRTLRQMVRASMRAAIVIIQRILSSAALAQRARTPLDSGGRIERLFRDGVDTKVRVETPSYETPSYEAPSWNRSLESVTPDSPTRSLSRP